MRGSGWLRRGQRCSEYGNRRKDTDGMGDEFRAVAIKGHFFLQIFSR